MKCTSCGHEADPICPACGAQGTMEDDPIDKLTDEQRYMMNDWNESDLDGACHNVASRLASDVNNGGIGAQVRFLLEQGMTFEQIADAREE